MLGKQATTRRDKNNGRSVGRVMPKVNPTVGQKTTAHCGPAAIHFGGAGAPPHFMFRDPMRWPAAPAARFSVRALLCLFIARRVISFAHHSPDSPQTLA